MKALAPLPRKAAEDDELANLALLIVPLLAITVAIFVLAVIFMVAFVAGPPAGGVFWWSRLTQRYQISKAKKVTCALVGAGLLVSPLILMALLEPSGWHHDTNSVLSAVWLGTVLGLCGTALYLAIEAYRQVFWQHRRNILAEQWKTPGVRHQLWKAQRALHGLEKAMARNEEANQKLMAQQKALEEKMGRMIETSDVRFYSAEKYRWQGIYEAMSTEDLKQRSESLNREIVQLPETDPRCMPLTLEAAVVRLEVQDRMLACGTYGSHRETLAEHGKKTQMVRSLQQKLQAIQAKVDRERTVIQELRRTRPVVN